MRLVTPVPPPFCLPHIIAHCLKMLFKWWYALLDRPPCLASLRSTSRNGQARLSWTVTRHAATPQGTDITAVAQYNHSAPVHASTGTSYASNASRLIGNVAFFHSMQDRVDPPRHEVQQATAKRNLGRLGYNLSSKRKRLEWLVQTTPNGSSRGRTRRRALLIRLKAPTIGFL